MKLVGYSAAVWVLRKAYPESTQGFVRVGTVRTAIGVGAGALYGMAWWAVANYWTHTIDPSMVLYFLGLIPVRIIE